MEDIVIIRPVEKEDLSRILYLCTLHAEFEKIPFRLDGQVSRLARDIFSHNPKLYCLVAVSQGEVIAYATYMKQYATWDAGEYMYLDCLFVLENFRSQGIGEKIMNQVKEHSAKLGCDLIQWQTPDFNVKAMKFYRRIGAQSKAKERFFLNLTSQNEKG